MNLLRRLVKRMCTAYVPRQPKSRASHTSARRAKLGQSRHRLCDPLVRLGVRFFQPKPASNASVSVVYGCVFGDHCGNALPLPFAIPQDLLASFKHVARDALQAHRFKSVSIW